MPLPPALLAAALQHPCFAGVFDRGNRIQVHQGSAGPVEMIDFQCEDCLTFRLGCAASDLPQGVSHDQAAQLITDHVRKARGYALSVGGYHTVISGWLNAVYWETAGIFAIRGDRGYSPSKPDLDVLIFAMQKGLIKPKHPSMLDSKEYVTQEVYLSVVPPPVVTTMAALLASPHISPAWKMGSCKVTLAEFLPVSRAQSVTPVSAAPAPETAPPPQKAKKVAGERCPACGEIIGERWLLTSSYIGCRCG